MLGQLYLQLGKRQHESEPLTDRQRLRVPQVPRTWRRQILLAAYVSC